MNINHFIHKKDRAVELLQEGIDHLEEAYNLFTDVEDSMSFNENKFMDKLESLINQIASLVEKEEKDDKKLRSFEDDDEDNQDGDDDDLTTDEDNQDGDDDDLTTDED